MILHHIGILSNDIKREAQHLAESCGYVPASGEIVDEVQTARVMFLRPSEREGGGAFLELVSPYGDKSKLKGSLKKNQKFHHVCFQSDDIFSDLKNFRSKGFFVLSEPVVASAFPGRKIAWVMDSNRNLFEIVESADGHQVLEL